MNAQNIGSFAAPPSFTGGLGGLEEAANQQKIYHDRTQAANIQEIKRPTSYQLFEHLGKEIECLGEDLNTLRSRLAPVLIPQMNGTQAAPTGAQGVPAISPTAELILRLLATVHGCRQMIECTQRHLDLP